ncbi:YbaL family putative K(+) efflux transporter [Hyphomicrobium sp. LHD-15]|uniref:YbaL family putative K(+) efflux transporter n=1 Tax=Hyphomicrobium sp. LHD-15 TaxID=3072142 RepID=UPI0028109407|nr:YbaL family putative K(+) efflux transporter [Hyphomicrobium sp. LHD-15]MDQ8698463.1 YbaL family putative K(+) efflux transporter [Hyphomicrobium sp. LHD-15]
MEHDISLIATISMGLVLAFIGGLIAQKVSLPPLVGYLLAGVALGPYTPGFVGDAHIAGQLAEIGVMLLMFGVGLHFSINDLLEVRGIALPGAIVQIAVATGAGLGLALLWGWTVGAGLVFGLALSVASTVVLLRALEQRNALDSLNGQIAVGWLIVEDLAMVLALVLLPALAGALGGEGEARGVASQLSGGSVVVTLLLTLGKVAIFTALVFVVGTRAVPWLLQLVARTGSRELFTLAVLAIALGIAYGSAELFGVSFALGAFFAGVVLSESDFSHKAAADSLPLQDAFAVLFFVSVGMLFDPSILVREPLAVIATVLLIVFGKSIAAFAIVLARGYPIVTALTVSASLAQIGEFSFILAALGVSLGLLPPEGRDLILAGAILSITLNPLVFAGIDPAANWIKARPKLLSWLERPTGFETLPDRDKSPSLKDHAIIVGYGRVGSDIVDVLKEQGLAFVVIDQDRRRVEDLRKRGISAVYGDATAPGVLEAAGVASARLLILALPPSYQKRQILTLARDLNPRIDTAVRTHRASELAYLKTQGIGFAIMGTREVSLGLLGYTLTSLGLTPERAEAIVKTARLSGDGAAFEPSEDADLPEAPELREHRESEGSS